MSGRMPAGTKLCLWHGQWGEQGNSSGKGEPRTHCDQWSGYQ